MASYLLPALAAAWPAMRGPLGIEDRTLSGRGYALTFDDGPHAQGTPAVLEILAEAGVQRDLLPGGRAGAAKPRAGRRDHRGWPCDRPALPPPRNLLRLTPGQVREDIAKAQEVIERATGREVGALSASLRHHQRVGAAPCPGARLASAAVERVGHGTGGTRHARVDRGTRHRRSGDGLGAAAPRRRRLLGARARGGAPPRPCRVFWRSSLAGDSMRWRPEDATRSLWVGG